MQEAAHGIWGGDDPQIGFGGAVGSASTLFPVTQDPQRGLELLRKLALCQSQTLANIGYWLCG
jgi:hypothetical protein